ncbi:MAG: thiamine diphosphokinase [Treponema sp.]|jgi:thiamine pyrophosphokinase|nr:thiamine diphosphokinase [Treponema sp.]
MAVRGIAFIGGEGPEPNKSRRLAAGADIIVAADSGLIAAEEAGVKPDWIIGDMDSLNDPSRLETYPPQRIRLYPADKDYTDTELALMLLWEKGCEEIGLIGGGGGRTDHLFAIRALFERPRCPDQWFTAGEELHCLKAPDSVRFRVLPGNLISLFPVGAGPWSAKSQGLKWTLDGLLWDPGIFGISNAALETHFSVSAEKGRFLVIINQKD